MMNLNGMWYEVEGLDGYTDEIKDAILDNKKIAFEWDEDGSRSLAVLHSVDGGTFYKGTFGSPRPEPSCTMELTRFTATSGEVLLWVKWRNGDTGFGGIAIAHLATVWDD